MENIKLSLFDQKEIRKTMFEWDWWYVVEDVIFYLTASKNTKQYLKDLKRNDESFRDDWMYVKILTIDTKWWLQKLSCANNNWTLRLIESITSKKAEPYKKWLSSLWEQRLIDLENQWVSDFKSEIFCNSTKSKKSDEKNV